MANDFLKFKKGPYAKLAAIAKDPGTIYVTTDEQAMYVDIDEDTRIRLGETIHFDTLTEFQSFLNATTPPYDTRAFYYIEEENALLKWVSEGGQFKEKGNWKQINSTAAVTAEINAVKNSVSAIETEQVTQNTNIAANTNAITRIDGEIGETNGSTEGSLWKAIKENKAAIESNDRDITNLQNDKLDKSTFESYKTDVTNSFNAVNNKLGSSTDTTNNKTAFQRIEALESSNSTKAAQADLEELNKTVYGSADRTLQDTGLVKKVEALETNSATKAALKEATDDIAEHATALTGLRNDLGNTTDGSSATTTAFGRIKKLEEAVGDGTGGSLSGRVKTLEETVGDASSGLVKDVNTIKTTIGDKTSPANGTIYKEIADIKNVNDAQSTSIANLTKALNGDSQAPADSIEQLGIVGRLAAVEAQADATDAEIGDRDSTITQTTLWSAIKANKDAAAANNEAINNTTTGLIKKVGDNARNISANSTAITNINNTIGTKDPSITENTVWDAIKANKDGIGELRGTIIEKINAANGMTYKGGVRQYSELPKLSSGIEIGDTYVAIQGFSYKDSATNDDVQVYAGDLLIASGTETGKVITSNLKWTLVNTGYIKSHESTLGIIPPSGQAPQNSTSIALTSHVAGNASKGDLGVITLQSENLTISSTANVVSGGAISINMYWEDFE